MNANDRNASLPNDTAKRRPNWVLVAQFALLIPLLLLGGQAVFSGMTEGRCFIWPGIGTQFAGGYSERAFDQIAPGQSQTDVVKLLGQPLRTGRERCAPSGHAAWRRGDETWFYSQDSSSSVRGGDWAWLSREVVFRDGRVTQTVRWTYHD